MTPAQSLGRYMKRAIRRRGLLYVDVANAIGTSDVTVSHWCSGRRLPMLSMVAAVSELIGDERMLAYAKRLRTKCCVMCGRSYVDLQKQMRATTCSHHCSKRKWARQRHQRAVDKSKLVRAALDRHRKAVAAYCAGCEPAGYCLTPECPLRDVSPLPLLRERQVGTVEPASTAMLSYIERRYGRAI